MICRTLLVLRRTNL